MTYLVISIILILIILEYILWSTNKTDKISFKDSIKLTDLPIITFYNNDQELSFLLDTGANRSIIDISVLKECHYKRLEDCNKLTGLDGVEHVVNNVEMILHHGDKTYSEVFQIQDMSGVFDDIKKETSVPVHGILGNTFFAKYKYVIDFNSLAVYTKKR